MTTTITGATGVNQITDDAITSSKLPSGSVLQVQSAVVTTVASSTVTDSSTIGGDVGLNVTITPLSSTSKFYISVDIGIASVSAGASLAGILSRAGSKVGNGTTSGNHQGVLFRGVDHVGNNGTDSNHGVGTSGSYVDNTSGSVGTSILYKLGLVGESGTSYINRVESDYNGSGNNVASTRTSSTIIVMEIEK